MADEIFDPTDGPKWVLDGRIVPMTGEADVIPSGRIYIDGGLIAAVQPSAEPPPEELGFPPKLAQTENDAPVRRTLDAGSSVIFAGIFFSRHAGPFDAQASRALVLRDYGREGDSGSRGETMGI